MSNKRMIMRECEHMNEARRVYEGKISSGKFFRTIRGNLLMAGNEAGNHKMMLDLVLSYLERNDMPTIVLSSHKELLTDLQVKRSTQGNIPVMTSCPVEKNYMPFYGMSAQHILRFVRIVAEEMGYKVLNDKLMLYSSAVLNVVLSKYPLSLPALIKLLEEDDDSISEFAIQAGLSNVIVDNIRGNHEAGIVFRRLCEFLEEVFEEIYTPGIDTKYNFQSGAKGDVVVMAAYVCSFNQHLMNTYLKEELYCTLKRVPRIRVILDEMPFEGENDELLKYLLTVKQQGKVELILSVKNAGGLFQNQATLDFSNIILFQQSTPASTDELSRKLFSTFQYHYPVPVAGDTLHVIFSIKKAVHWQIQTEERLRVRSQDLFLRKKLFGTLSDYLAVKTTANDNIYLIRTSDFLQQGTNYPRVV